MSSMLRRIATSTAPEPSTRMAASGRAMRVTSDPKIEIVGCQPQEGSQIPGIRKWPDAYLPKIFERGRVAVEADDRAGGGRGRGAGRPTRRRW